jgi:hypothetical protein
VNARDVKDALYGRHHGSGGQFPGAWTCIEEYRGIDFLAFSAWSSQQSYARIGYEVKVSRADYRRELLRPGKRMLAVEWCNQFFFAVPKGLLTKDEIAWVEPDWQPEDWQPTERCPGYLGQPCRPLGRRKTHTADVPIPYAPRTGDSARPPYVTRWDLWERVTCPTCGGKGHAVASRVEREAPTCWVPKDVGLVVVDGRGARVAKGAPHRREVPALDPRELGQLVRWVSMRPDPRHHPREAEAAA